MPTKEADYPAATDHKHTSGPTPDRLPTVSYTHLTLPTICSV